MKEKKNKEKRIFRLLILDEKNFQPIFSIKLNNINIIFYFGGILLIIIILSLLLWRYTPLNRFLPKYQDTKLMNQIVETSLLIDSLENEINLRDDYFNKIRAIVLNENIDSMAVIDSSIMTKNILTNQNYDSIIKELQEKTKMTEIQNLTKEEETEISNLNFHKPVEGTISNNFNPAAGHFGIDIVGKNKAPVMSVLPGTVILATWSINTGYVIEIQHPNNMISVYKHNSQLLKKEGDRVNAGDVIALLGNTGEITTGPHLHFELWYNGKPVNPTDYIVF